MVFNAPAVIVIFLAGCGAVKIKKPCKNCGADSAVNVALAEYERIRKYTITFSPILNSDDSVSSFKEWVLANISSWSDGDLVKLTSSNNRNAYFHLMKQSNTNFNLFYYTYYQQYPIVYRYVDTSWRIVTPTSTSATW